MSAENRPFDKSQGTLYKCRESAPRQMLLVILLLLFLLVPFLAFCLALMLPTFWQDFSRAWSIPLALACVLPLILVAWIQTIRNIRRTTLTVTEEGLIYHIPVSKYFGDVYIRYSDISTFARTTRETSLVITQFLIDYQDVRPLSTRQQNPELPYLVGNGWLFREEAPPGMPWVKPGKPRWHEGTLIQLAMFEKNWQEGEIGKALRKHRPDLVIPDASTPLPRAYNPNPDYGGN